ncbi:MAG: hypothetical protein ACRC33_25705 [Gemmataceae bacterium]
MSDENIRKGSGSSRDPRPEPVSGRGDGKTDKSLKAGSGSGLACPRCGGPVAVGSNPVLMQFGLIGMLIQLLTTSYGCPKCGPLKFREFPPEVRSKQRRGTLLVILFFVLVFGAGIAVAIWMSAS